MKVAIIGNGGREAALRYFLKRRPLVGSVECLTGDPNNLAALLEKVNKCGAELTIVGPEAFLEKGIVDVFRSAGKAIVGPTKAAARIETSKIFARDLMRQSDVPSPAFRVFYDFDTAKTYINEVGIPLVVKIDGLAAGKGVIVASTPEEALAAIDTLGTMYPGQGMVIEERLQGKECSFMVLSDGEHVVTLPSARDYKQLYPGGPNTGGMGCIAPVPEMNEKLEKQILERIINPTLKALRDRGMPFQGVLYAGLMLTASGPKVLEFNARFGDPELQTILPLLRFDIFPLLHATTNNTCSYRVIERKNQVSVCVVLASRGYPGSPEIGFPISGLEEAEKLPNVNIFHAGTRFAEGKYFTNGGRVLSIVATGKNLLAARALVYQAVNLISFEGMQCRPDIGS